MVDEAVQSARLAGNILKLNCVRNMRAEGEFEATRAEPRRHAKSAARQPAGSRWFSRVVELAEGFGKADPGLRSPLAGSGPRWRIAIVLSTFLTGVAGLAQAATPTQQSDITLQSNAITQQQQQRLNDLLKKNDQSLKRPTPSKAGITAAAPIRGKSGRCFPIDDIVLDGADSLKAKTRAELVQPFRHTCIGLIEIQNLLRRITNFYISKGMVTSRVYIPQQDLGAHVLRLRVEEGRIERIQHVDKTSRVNLGTAFPELTGKVLNIRDIEQGLDQINRLQSNHAKMQLLPGSAPGKTVIDVGNRRTRPFHVTDSLDNSGSKSTGRYVNTLTFGLDNPLGLNDYWMLSLSSNLNPAEGSKLSQSGLLSASIPYGYWTFDGSVSRSRYATVVTSQGQSFHSTGNTQTYHLGTSRVIHRDQTRKTTLSFGLTQKKPRNFIEGVELDSSSRNLMTADLGLTSVFPGAGGDWTLTGKVTRGLPWFGVSELPGAGSGSVPKALFWKINAGASYIRNVKLGIGTPAQWSSSVQAQFSPDHLFGSEQIAIGGRYTVRGYDATSVSGDSGIYWHNELAVTLGTPRSAWVAHWLGRFQVYADLDAGRVVSHDGGLNGTLVGADMGVRSVMGLANLDLGIGTPVYTSASVRNAYTVERQVIYLSLGVNF